MNRPRITRALRITWTAFFGIAAVLLVILWIRSYYAVDSLVYWFGNSSRVVAVDSRDGRVYVSGSVSGGVNLQPLLTNDHPTTNEADLINRINQSQNTLGFGAFIAPKLINTSTLIFPHWFSIVLSAAFASAPWIRWSNRFSYVGACQV